MKDRVEMSTEIPAVNAHADKLFARHYGNILRKTDRLFAWLMIAQVIAGIAAAIWISPLTWIGTTSQVHLHVWAAVFLGLAITIFPAYLAFTRPGATITRHVIAAGQMLVSALLIHITGGRIETHFHIFGSLAFLAFYRDWRVLITATLVVAADHFFRGLYYPQSVFGVLTASKWRWVEHAAWVLFEDIFLIRACLNGVQEIKQITFRRAQLEQTNNLIESQVQERTEALTKSENEVLAIFNAAVDGILTIDQRGLIQRANRAAEEMFGYSFEELEGRNINLLMPEPYHSEHDGYLANYLRTGEAKVIGTGREVIGQRKDKSTFFMELSVSEVVDSGEKFFTGIVRDITERKRAEEDLLIAKNLADQANVAKSQFMANMSHELRTPMNAIIGYSEILEEEASAAGMENFVSDLQRIHSSGRHLLRLINEILDLSKIEAGQSELCPETFNVKNMIDDVASTIKPLIQKNGNVLEIHCPENVPEMTNDLTRVRQVLFNLLSNAAKFTKNGSIAVRVSVENQSGQEYITFHVQDHGIGLSPEQLDRVFEPFIQADNSTTRKYGGTGLGLTICRKFCQMMGGDITVESELGRGSTFSARVLAQLPGRDSGQGHTETHPPAPLAPEKNETEDGSLVLVIDDDSSALELVSRMLTSDGFRVMTASRGESGIQLAREHKPVAILLDVMMPSVDGWAILSALKSDLKLADIPVIMHTMVADQDLGYALGASDYLAKPVSRTQLLHTVARYQKSASTHSLLVVEDDANTRDMVCRIMRKEGWRVYSAENGRVGLQRMTEKVPDMILLDLMMPEMDGFQFIEEVRKRPAWQSVPVVVLTAKEITPETRRQLEGRVTRILQKGEQSREDLLNELNQFVRKHAAASRNDSESEA